MSLKLLKGDCLEIMKDLSDNSIDLFLCDLPFGCLTNKNHSDGIPGENKGGVRARFIDGKDTGTKLNVKHIDVCSWDVKIDLEKFWEQVKRLARNKHTPVIHFCSAKFGYDLIKSNEKWFRYDLVWEKTNAVGFLSANKMPMRAHENIYVFSKAGAYYKRVDISGDFPPGGGGRSTANFLPIAGMPNLGTTEAGRRCVKSVVTIPNKKTKGGHPTQKPIELYKWLIERYCPEGGTILDPTAGSFTSCKAANELGRNAIGIEKDEKFYEKGNSIFFH